jgi:hypothetical protein
MVPRPKSDNFVAFKCPTDLREDALALAALGGKTESEIWKEAMEFRLSFVRMVRMGYWQLRTVEPLCEVQPGSTKLAKV